MDPEPDLATGFRAGWIQESGENWGLKQYPLVMTNRHSHGFSMALMEIDGLAIKNGDFL